MPTNSRLSYSFTVMSLAPATTWLFVRTYTFLPSLRTMMPEPRPCSWYSFGALFSSGAWFGSPKKNRQGESASGCSVEVPTTSSSTTAGNTELATLLKADCMALAWEIASAVATDEVTAVSA